MSLNQIFRILSRVDNTVPLTLTDLMTGENITMHVTLSAYNKAQTDSVFATDLLNKHKAFLSERLAASLTSDETSTKAPAIQKELEVVDDVSGKTYTIIVSEEQYDNAMNDPAYAKLLLKQQLDDNKGEDGEFEESMIQEYKDDLKTAESANENSSPNAQSERTSWTSEQTKLLLALYEDENEKKDNRAMWKNIVQRMVKQGYKFTIVKCQRKIENLKKEYKDVLLHNKKSGNDKRKAEHYELLEQVFGKKKWANPLSVAGSNLSIEELDKLGPSCKRQKAAFESVRLRYYQEGIESRRQQRELRERKVAALEKLAASLCKKD